MMMVCVRCALPRGACRCRSYWLFGYLQRWVADMPLLWEGDQA